MMHRILYLLVFFTASINAQSPLNTVVGLDSDIPDIYDVLYIGTFGSNEQQYFDYEGLTYNHRYGFQYLVLGATEIPVHIEDNDDFDFVLLNDASFKDAYFTGDKGAVKNNYIFSRYLTVKLEERKPDFLKDKIVLKNRISHLSDSLIDVAKGFALSDSFIEDERSYWKTYDDYLQTFYDVLKNPDSVSLNTIATTAFSQNEYKDARLINYFKEYVLLAHTYYNNKIIDSRSPVILKQLFTKQDAPLLKNVVAASLLNDAFSRKPDAAIYYDTYMYLVGKDPDVTKKYIKQQKGASGIPFPKSKLYDAFNKRFELHDVQGKKIAVLMYDPRSKGLKDIFLNWNTFFVNHKNDYDAFITINLWAPLNAAAFKGTLPFDQVVGTHLFQKYNTRSGINLRNTLAIYTDGLAISMDATGTINSFDILKDFTFNYLSDKPTATLDTLPPLGMF